MQQGGCFIGKALFGVIDIALHDAGNLRQLQLGKELQEPLHIAVFRIAPELPVIIGR